MRFTFSIVQAAISGLALIHLALGHSTDRNPISHVHLVENATIGTPSRRVHAFSHFDLNFIIHGRPVRLQLEPNHDILDDTLHVTRLDGNGNIMEMVPVERTDFKVFKGNAFVQHAGTDHWTQTGWARITFHRDGKDPVFEGVFRVDGDHHHIHSLKDYRRTKLIQDPDVEIHDGTDVGSVMVVWKDSSVMNDYFHSPELKRAVMQGPAGCAADSLKANSDFNPLRRRDDAPEEEGGDEIDLGTFGFSAVRNLFSRQIDSSGTAGAGVNLASTVGSTAGCFTSRRVALIGIATDCTYQQDFDSEEDMRTNVIRQVNSASAVYESSFNISLGIQNLTVTGRDCPTTANPSAPWNVDCSASGVDITERLTLFSSWRSQSQDDNAFWTLLSKCNTGSAVGLAWLGQLCVTSGATDSGTNDTVSSANVVVRTSTEWQVLAHEIGHTFGAVHDCTADTCAQGLDDTSQCCPLSASTCDANGQFLMNPSTGNNLTSFSPCSIGNICSAIGRSSVKTSCLSTNKNVATITGAQCGNGIVETGEDCDCGGESGCGDNSCCDAQTCKFTSGSQCDPSNEDCCTDSCQFASAGTVCRASTGSCDPEETCSGSAATCPANMYSKDGTSCGSGLQCASGQCTSRDQQCKAMMGSNTTTSSTSSVACGDDTSCQMQCTSPRLSASTCVGLQQNFLDGTPCGSGGTCDSGSCTGQSIGKELGSFFQRNKHIIIPVVATVGGLLVLMITWGIISSVRRRLARNKRRRIRAANKAAAQAALAQAYQGAGIPPSGRWRSSQRQMRPEGDVAVPPPAYTAAGPRYA